MNKKYEVKQNGIKNCAAACLKSIIKFYGGNISISELEYIIKTDTYGTNAYNMIEGMKTLGFSGIGRREEFNKLINEEDIFPCIAHTKTNYGYHYVCIYGVNKKNKTFNIMDPSIGNIKMSYDEFRDRYMGVILIFRKVAEIPMINDSNELLHFIISRVINKRKSILIVSFISLIVTLLSVVMNYNLKLNIDYFLNTKRTSIFITIIIFIIIVLLKNIFSLIRDKFIRNIEMDINESINHKLIHHLFGIPYKLFYSRPTGEIISRINDLEYLKNFIQELFLNIFVDIFIIIISLIGLLFLSKRLTFIMIILIILYLIVSLIFKSIYKRVILNLQISSSNYQTSLIESINSFESINNLNTKNDTIYNLDNEYYKVLKMNKLFKKILSIESFIKNLIIDINYILVINYGMILVLNSTITLGDLVGYTGIMTLFITPIRNIIDSLVQYVYSLNSYNRINDFLLIKEMDYVETKEMINGNIKIENVKYENNKTIIDNLSFTINEKDKVFLSGKSGSGKSTLLKIIKKYINDYTGDIYINDYNLKDINPQIINNSFLYVSQNEHLYSKSIKDNIIQNKKISNKKYNHIKNITLVDQIFESKPLRDNELIEEDGFNISGGERQKIILARALMNEFNYLILDEALSEVDDADEERIIKNILNEYKDKTIIYVSHKNYMKKLFEKEIKMEEEK